MESKFLSYFLEFMVNDWFASIPITICSVLTIAVMVERYLYYQQNRRDVTQFIHTLQRDLESNNLQKARSLATSLVASSAK